MNLPPFLSRLFAFALLLALVPVSANAQVTEEAMETTDVETEEVSIPDAENGAAANAEARTQFGEAIEAAQAANEMSTAEGFIEAAEHYLEAAEIAMGSGDAELEARVTDVKSNASKAYVNAGSAYSEADDIASAAAQFEQAAEIAREIDDTEFGAKTYYNAGVAYVTAEEYENALAALDAAIEMSPDNLDYYYVRGVALNKSGDAEASEAALMELAEKAEAADDAAMASKARQTVGKSYLSAAYADLQGGRFSAAVAGLDKAAPFLAEDDATLNTLYANSYYKLGVEQVQAERFDAAQRSLQQAQTHARRAGKDNIVTGAQAQLDYIAQVQAQG
jgi:tetratricopeptide (TPR) repeat protein